MAQVMALLQSLLAALMEGSPEDSGLGGFLRFRGARQRGLPGGDDGLGGFLRFRGGRRWGLFTRKIAPVLEAKDTGEFIRALENVVVAIDGSRPRVMNSEDAFVLEVAPGQTVQLTGEQVRSLVAERRETAAKTHQMRLDAAVTKAVERGVPPAILNPVRALMQVAEDGDGEGAGDITLEGVDGTFSPFGVLVHLLENCPSRLGEASEGITGEKPENAEEETGTMSFEEAEEHERKRRRELVQSGWLPGRVTEDAEI